MTMLGVSTMNVVGLSYGGFVAYSIAAQFPLRIEKLVLCCAGVCMEDKDMDKGMFKVGSVEEAISILLPQTPDKVRQLIRLSFHKPIRRVPSCFLQDFVEVTVICCTALSGQYKCLFEMVGYYGILDIVRNSQS